MTGWKQFIGSPQNRTGLAIWLGTAVTALLQYALLQQVPSSTALFGLVLGLVKIVEPETTATVAQLQKAVVDVKEVLSTHDAAALVSAMADAQGLVQALKPVGKAG